MGYDIKDYLSLRDPADRVRFYIADAVEGEKGRLPFDDNTFDLIISSQVLAHVMDQVGMLWELFRVMRPGADHYIALYEALVRNLIMNFDRSDHLGFFSPFLCTHKRTDHSF